MPGGPTLSLDSTSTPRWLRAPPWPGLSSSTSFSGGSVGLTESTISHHLGQLRKAGLVSSDRRGMNVFHRVRPEAPQALCLTLDPNGCA